MVIYDERKIKGMRGTSDITGKGIGKQKVGNERNNKRMGKRTR